MHCIVSNWGHKIISEGYILAWPLTMVSVIHYKTNQDNTMSNNHEGKESLLPSPNSKYYLVLWMSSEFSPPTRAAGTRSSDRPQASRSTSSWLKHSRSWIKRSSYKSVLGTLLPDPVFVTHLLGGSVKTAHPRNSTDGVYKDGSVKFFVWFHELTFRKGVCMKACLFPRCKIVYILGS